MGNNRWKTKASEAAKASSRPAATGSQSTRATTTKNGNDSSSGSRATKMPSKGSDKGSQRMPKSGILETYFDLATKGYFVAIENGDYQPLPKDELSKLLRRKGFSDKMRLDDGLSWLESEILDITLQKSVHFAGALGGYSPGLYQIFASRILVTSGPSLIKPVQGKWPHLRAFLDALLGEQWRYFAAWLKVALQSLRLGFPWAPGQLLALSGPSSCGKSNLQKLLTPMLGNRVSSPYEYMSSSTNFNSEIYGAEHGLIGDTNHKTDQRARRNFGAAIKKLVAEPLHYVRGLYKNPISLTPFLRLSMTCNDNDDALKVLPSIDSDVAGKIMLLRARSVDYPKLTARFKNWVEYWEKLESELPAFVHALTRWQIPVGIADTRYGVVSFKDDELMVRLQKLTKEDNLLATIDAYLFQDRCVDHWAGLAGDLVRELGKKMNAAGESRLYESVNHCGQMLALLCEKYPERVTAQKIGKNKVSYLIVPE